MPSILAGLPLVARLSFSDGSHYEKRGKGEPVCIDDEIPFEIPESWEWVRLGSILELVSDGTHKTPEYKDSGVLFLSVQNVSKGYFDLSKVKYVSRETHDELCKRVKPRNRDILLCRIGTLGKPIIVDVDFEFSIFVSLGLLRLIDERMAEWVVACINAPIGFQWIQRVKVGGGTHTFKINLGDIPNFLIPLPPYEEQLRIQEKLSAILNHVGDYEELQDARERLDAELPDRLRKSILQLAVQGKLVPQDPTDEPASALLDRIRAERASLVKAKKIKAPKGGESVIYRASDGGYYEKRGKGEPVRIDDEIPFDIPESWEWTRVASVFNLVRGSGIKRTEVTETGEPCVRYGELYTTYRSEITVAVSHTSSTVYGKAQKLCDGEVVATLTGENDIDIGRAVVNNTGETIAFGGDLLALKGNYLDGNFAMLSLNAPYMSSQRTTAASGNIIVHLSADKIGNFLMAVPPLDEQRRVVSRCKELLAAIS